ncbi:hypothetical protein E2320_015870, partial [Naja naja]
MLDHREKEYSHNLAIAMGKWQEMTKE